jgi:hypothetical protein
VEQVQQYVGIDLHRRRSVIVRRTESGETLDTVRIDNDPVTLAAELAKAGEHPEVIVEATYGWYWAADVIQECGGNVHLAHPLGNNWGNRRVKNDERDATDLVDLFRMGRLAEGWVAPPALRELRELIRYRAKLVHLRSNLKAQVHAVLAKEGVAVPMTDLFGVGGQRLLDEVKLGRAYRIRVESLRDLIELCDREIAILEKETARSSPATSATTPSRPSLGSARCWPRSSWPRSATSRGSRPHGTSPVGPGSPPLTTSPTRRSVVDTSPSRAHAWCGGPPSRRFPASGATLPSGPITNRWANAAAPRSDEWRPPASFLSSSTTACVTARSVAWPRRGETRNGRSPVRAR